MKEPLKRTFIYALLILAFLIVVAGAGPPVAASPQQKGAAVAAPRLSTGTLMANAHGLTDSAPSAPKGAAAPRSAQGDGDYVGSDTCLACHEAPAKAFHATIMGKAFAKPRNELEKRGCESCHGPGKAHVEGGGNKDAIIRFTKDSHNTAAEKNSGCLDCHSRGKQMFWKASPHESRGLACADCHTGHQPKQAMVSSDARYSAPLTLTRSVKKQQPELCLSCHQMRKAQLQRSSHMPYREGKVTCTSCHNPHGTPNFKLLHQATTNENCLSCHTERRGPFTYEHPPVMENCANCHEAHGTNNPQLLKVRMPRVCDSCHVAGRHPVTPTLLNSSRDFNRACTNCHSQIHGSNHPSGKMFLR